MERVSVGAETIEELDGTLTSWCGKYDWNNWRLERGLSIRKWPKAYPASSLTQKCETLQKTLISKSLTPWWLYIDPEWAISGQNSYLKHWLFKCFQSSDCKERTEISHSFLIERRPGPLRSPVLSWSKKNNYIPSKTNTCHNFIALVIVTILLKG